MAIESLLAIGLATVFLILLAWYTSSHRAEDKKNRRLDDPPS